MMVMMVMSGYGLVTRRLWVVMAPRNPCTAPRNPMALCLETPGAPRLKTPGDKI